MADALRDTKKRKHNHTRQWTFWSCGDSEVDSSRRNRDGKCQVTFSSLCHNQPLLLWHKPVPVTSSVIFLFFCMLSGRFPVNVDACVAGPWMVVSEIESVDGYSLSSMAQLPNNLSAALANAGGAPLHRGGN